MRKNTDQKNSEYWVVLHPVSHDKLTHFLLIKLFSVEFLIFVLVADDILLFAYI